LLDPTSTRDGVRVTSMMMSAFVSSPRRTSHSLYARARARSSPPVGTDGGGDAWVSITTFFPCRCWTRSSICFTRASVSGLKKSASSRSTAA
jgi:hypothetical protein